MPSDYFIRPSCRAIEVREGNMQDVYTFLGKFDLDVWKRAKNGDFIMQSGDEFIIVKPDVFHAIFQKGT